MGSIGAGLLFAQQDTLPDPFQTQDPLNPNGFETNVDLNTPDNIQEEIIYDPVSGTYKVQSKIGDFNYGNPTEMTMEEYLEYEKNKKERAFFEDQIKQNNSTKPEEKEEEDTEFSLGVKVKKADLFRRMFGSDRISLTPKGSAEISLGVASNKVDNPAIPVKQRRQTNFDFNMRAQINLLGSVGDNLKIKFNYNTEATFEFENQIKLEFTGDEDMIIQKLEAGNVSLPLNSSLITGAQGLFGVKSELKFGRLTATTVFSQQKSERKSVEVKGGAQVQEFEIEGSNYEANKHYFLSMHFRERYDNDMLQLPLVPAGAQINRIEVWVTNTSGKYEDTRDIIALADLGEYAVPRAVASPYDSYVNKPYDQGQLNNTSSTYPDNNNSPIYASLAGDPNIRGFDNAIQVLSQAQFFYSPAQPMQQAVDYERIENARKLTPSEYTYNARLGFISLTQSLNNDEVLAVAYEYTDERGQVHQVGEFSTDGVDNDEALLLKMLKGTLVNTRLPYWHLMMKNVYNMGAFQVSSQDFFMDLFYNNPRSGVDVNFIPEEGIKNIPLLQLLSFDRLNANASNTPDGFYDFIDNATTTPGTINSRNGRIYLPTVEPFGSSMEKYVRARLQNAGLTAIQIEKVVKATVFDELYDSTKTAAQQVPELDRFSFKGRYQSSSGSDIPLNAINIPQNSVTVTAGGNKLVEGVDYTVDYTLGRVKIINTGLLESGAPIKVDFESNSLFSVQQKTLLATHFNYEFNPNFNIGATFMRLSEQPITQKVNAGDEPIANNVVGVNLDYSTKLPWLTRIVDAIPLINTRAESNISVSGEFAYLIPGQPKILGKGGVSYIDDFEGSQSTIDIRNPYAWKLASTPQGQASKFPEADSINSLAYGRNRANLNWYTIDPVFTRNSNLTPDNISGNLDIQGNLYQREVYYDELFPNKEIQSGTPNNLTTLDLSYYPEERGPYNFDVQPTSYSAGMDPTTGALNQPESRWGGVMRSLQTTDFELANIEYIQFWLMDPFTSEAVDGGHDGEGKLYFNLGNISEDILRDGKKSYENGLPSTEAEALDMNNNIVSVWGRIPSEQQIITAFDNEPSSRPFQDAGLDGLINAAEQLHYADFINQVNAFVTNLDVRNRLISDPAGDDYIHYLDGDYDAASANVLQRYKRFNGVEGNSPINEGAVSTSATNMPDVEDVNNDFVTSGSEQYFEYEIDMSKNGLQVGRNYIVNEFDANLSGKNTNLSEVKWYHFKIPVAEFTGKVGSITDFRSIRFIRMYMQGFDKPVVLRMARFELVRGEWRRFLRSLETPGEGIVQDPNAPTFNISAVSVEEHGSRIPVNYVTPPGIQRELQFLGNQTLQQNEQALELQIGDLQDGDARAAFKNVAFDVLSYKKLKMYVHAEPMDIATPINNNDLTLFVRIGSDYNENYYEYELPLTITQINNGIVGDADAIWPAGNDVEIVFDDLKALKASRNATSVPLFQRFSKNIGNSRVLTVKGNPNLQNLKTVMIGVRNPDVNDPHVWQPDDGQPKSVIVWANELRLSDFDNKGGWATIGQMNIKMADFANLQVAGQMSTPGWGALDSKVSDRQRETIQSVDANSTVQLGKFFGDNAGVRLPMFLGFSEEIITPRFDPSSGDIEMSELEQYYTKEESDQQKREVVSRRTRRSINFTNVGLAPAKNATKIRFYSPSNLSLSYSYSEEYFKDYFTDHDINKNYRYGLNYSFANKPFVFEPFKKNKLMKKNKWWDIIRDFNLGLGPKSVAFNTDFNRTYNQRKLKPIIDGSITPYLVNKKYTWNRNYKLNWDLMKNLKFKFNARNVALIGEPDTITDKNRFPDTYQRVQDSIWNSMKSFGLNTDYQHDYSIDYDLPIDKIPLLDWTSASISYKGAFQWTRMPIIKYDTNIRIHQGTYNVGDVLNPQDYLGNTIQNSRNINVNARLNFANLYKKSKYLRKVDMKFKRMGKGRNSSAQRNKKSSTGQGPQNQDQDEEKKKKKDSDITALDYIVKFGMMLNNITGTYSVTNGTFIPGYAMETQILGFDSKFNGPGFGFLIGNQDINPFGKYKNLNERFAPTMAEKGWLVENSLVSGQYTTTHTENLQLKASLEPLQDLRIDLTADRKYASNTAEFYRFDDILDQFTSTGRAINGNYSVSFISIGSSFDKLDDENNSNVYAKFLEYRKEISKELGSEYNETPDTIPGYYTGFGPEQQYVLISAFTNAYGNKKNKFSTPLDVLPLPNWRVTYNGLTKFAVIKKAFKKFSLSHSYNSTYTVGGFASLISDSLSNDYDLNNNRIITEEGYARQYNTITISERFSPLIKFDMELNNSLQLRVEYKKDRNLALNLTNYQITEQRGQEYVIGAGYKIPNVKLPGSKKIKSDLTVNLDLSLRNNKTLVRKIVTNENQLTNGMNVLSIRSNMEYTLNKMIHFRLYFDYTRNTPQVSNSFPTENIRGGVSIRLTL